jgi:hypothetical protein
MKKLLKIIMGIVVFIILVVVLVFYLTGDMVDTADSFFKAVKQNDIAKARGYLAEEFKAATDEKALKDFLSSNALLKFKETSWGERQISGSRGELNGSVNTETGGTVPVKLTLVKESGAWKIYSLQKPTAGLTSKEEPGTSQQPGLVSTSKEEPSGSQKPALVLTPKGAAGTVPSHAEQIILAKKSMHDFAVSLKAKSMEHFRNNISNLWQRQFTTQKLNEAYGKIIEAELDLSVLDTLEPILYEEAQIDQDGVLILKGHYATQPSQVKFQQKFIKEGGVWKLIGFQFTLE